MPRQRSPGDTGLRPATKGGRRGDGLGQRAGIGGGLRDMTRYVAAIDQGTTSTRFMIFDRAGTIHANEEIANDQLEPRPGWVEHDPLELVERTLEVVRRGLHHARLEPSDIAAVGIANQRETSVVWERA